MKPKIFTFDWNERKVTIAIKSTSKSEPVWYLPPPDNEAYVVFIGWSIMRPGDRKSELGETIAIGRLKKDVEKGRCNGLLLAKPSINTLTSMAKDYFHYIINNPEEFFVDADEKRKQKLIEKSLEEKEDQATAELLAEKHPVGVE